VVIDHGTWAGPVLEAIQPDVYVKGKEYETNRDARFAKERQLVESFGGKVIFSSGDVVFSSTFVIGKFREQWQMEQARLSTYCKRHHITRQSIDEVLRLAANKKVLVLGDAVLDRYVHCEGLGVAAESPMLSVMPLKEEFFVGASGLIARQLASLGVSTTLLAAYGESADAAHFTTRLRDGGVEVLRASVDARPVYQKSRYLIDGRKVFKVDEGRRSPISTRGAKEFLALLDERLPEFDAVVATDFGYGTFTAEICEGITNAVKRTGKSLYVDVSHRGHASLSTLHHAKLATPTEQELRFAFGDLESGLSSLASRYLELTKAEALMVTLGKRGVVFFGSQVDSMGRLPTEYLPSMASHVVDEVGAGDVLLAGVVTAGLTGAPLAMGAWLGSALAANQVARLGNDPVVLGDLLEWSSTRPELAEDP
jgi:rfaE bifunctional protein kinase chain/domain